MAFAQITLTINLKHSERWYWNSDISALYDTPDIQATIVKSQLSACRSSRVTRAGSKTHTFNSRTCTISHGPPDSREAYFHELMYYSMRALEESKHMAYSGYAQFPAEMLYRVTQIRNTLF